jgi:NAD(P) transhydrogenase
MSAAERDFDLVVIGSGPAGEKAAAQAAYFGKRVAVVEKAHQPGGACVNTGTLPSKSLRESARFLSGFAARGLDAFYDIQKSQQTISVRNLMTRKEHVTAAENDRIRNNFERHNIKTLRGEGSFEDAHTVLVKSATGTQRVTAEIVLIATGTVPLNPPGIDFPDPDIDDSDSILELDRIPEELTILGGGVIGCEYASIFAALGVKVVLVEGRDRLLPFLDGEISTKLAEALRRSDVDLRLNERFELVERTKPGPHGLRVKLKSGADIVSDKLLFCGGRNSVTQGLGLEKLGIKTDERGRVAVDANYRTSVSNIYAAGDVIGFPSLASTGMEQGRLAMIHAFDLRYKSKLAEHLPYGIYTIPEISMVGATEEELQEKKIDYEVGRAYFRDNARGQIIGDVDGMLKLVFSAQSQQLLGVHIIGDRATELVHIGMLCLQLHSTIDDFIQAVFNYPTLSDLFKYAAYDGLGRLQRRRAFEQ